MGRMPSGSMSCAHLIFCVRDRLGVEGDRVRYQSRKISPISAAEIASRSTLVLGASEGVWG